MTPRSTRRAAERKAMKAARKTARNQAAALAPPVPACEPAMEDATASDLFVPPAISGAQLAANQANAQLSSGPVTPAGKAISSLNAVKTALTGRTVLLASDDSAAYQQHLRAYTEDFHPVGARECDLVQSIADTAWRLKRIPCLEAAVFAQGHIEFAQAFEDHAPELRPAMIELQTYLKYEKQLRNLQLQEARLARRREKDLAELHQLQQQRRSAEQEALELVANRYLAAQTTGQPFTPSAHGFVFSTEQIETHLERTQLRRRTAEAAGLAPRTARHAA